MPFEMSFAPFANATMSVQIMSNVIISVPFSSGLRGDGLFARRERMRHCFQEIEPPVHVAGLVVVPGQAFLWLAVADRRRAGVEHCRARPSAVVDGDERQ